MLPPAFRLTRGADFELAVRRGRRAGRTRLVVYAYPPGTNPPVSAGVAGSKATAGSKAATHGPQASTRVGFIVGRNVGGAVVRHRVQRRLRHLLRDRVDAFAPATLIVVRALAPAAGASSAELASDLDSALRKLRLIAGVA